jgi:ABC-type molybdate transport system substrate-binding protein
MVVSAELVTYISKWSETIEKVNIDGLGFIDVGCFVRRLQAEKGGSAKGKSEKVQITVSAAASLKDVLAELSSVYEKDHPNVSIKFNFGSSGALQQQIEQGAPADLFFSAAEDKFNRVVNQGLI